MKIYFATNRLIGAKKVGYSGKKRFSLHSWPNISEKRSFIDLKLQITT